MTADDRREAAGHAEADGRAVADVLTGLGHANDAVCSLHQFLGKDYIILIKIDNRLLTTFFIEDIQNVFKVSVIKTVFVLS